MKEKEEDAAETFRCRSSGDYNRARHVRYTVVNKMERYSSVETPLVPAAAGGTAD